MSFKPYGSLVSDFVASRPADYQSDIDKDAWEQDLVDISSYVPLDIRMKQMERAGVRAQFSSSDFTISELRQIFDNHDFEYSKDDDLEDIILKENARKAFMADILARKASENSSLAPGQMKDVPKEKNVSDPGEAQNLT